MVVILLKVQAYTLRAYKIKRGDTICSIAREYKTSIISILQVNKHMDPKQLTIGDTLCVPIEYSSEHT